MQTAYSAVGRGVEAERQMATTLGEYADRWLVMIRPPVVRPRTWASYRDTLRLHVRPTLGGMPLGDIRRYDLKALLAAKLAAGLARNSVRIIQSTLSALLAAAVDDEILGANPAAGLGRQLRLAAAARERQQTVATKALTRAQVAAFLDAVRMAPTAGARALYPLFLVLARAGLRIGEALALRWQDVDLTARTIAVVRAVSAGALGPPKRGAVRVVDMSRQVWATLRWLDRERQRRAVATERLGPGLFTNARGRPLDYARVRRVFVDAVVRAGLPRHFTPHSLRHTFASLLLQEGRSPAYVQRQLGHASIALTVDTYGRWLPHRDLAAVDGLDDPRALVLERRPAAPDR